MRTTIHVAALAVAVNLATAGVALADEAATDRPAGGAAIADAPRRAHHLHADLLPPELGAEPRADVAQVQAGGQVGVQGGATTSSDESWRGGKLPVRWVDRPLTLPKFVLAPHFLFDVTHGEALGFALNGFGLTAGAGFGILDDLDVYCDPLSLLIERVDIGGLSNTKTYYGTFRLGATYRFFHNELVELGARLEFGATGAVDLVHLTWGVPIVLHAAHVVRLTTGLFFSGLFPTQTSTVVGVGNDPDIAMSAVNEVAPVFLAPVGPGLPVVVDVQIAEPFFAGLDTGFGIASFRGNVDRNCFMPLGAHLGGTIPVGHKPLVDLIAGFSFPYFLLGADAEPPATQIWTVGLSARGYIQL